MYKQQQLIKEIVSVFIAVMLTTAGWAQDMKTFKLYKPDENAAAAIEKAIAEAKAGKKHVFIQIGGNWCIWCARFEDFVKNEKRIDSLVKSDYVVYHLNYSPENKNEEILAKYNYPQRFGFPVFLVLNGEGELLHTQNSAYLEEGKSYDAKKVFGFFQDWTKRALDPAQYKEE